MTILLNGRTCELPAPGTPAGALAELGLDPGARGVAVAVDGEVVPRAEWESLALSEGARVEVLTAMQGG
ncbi:MAG: sulfur carrier protein [Solirubrobacteraceae bacterium]|nr:thiamine biosynthesis protein ThiS [Solirubrobacterales bacterium]MEA2216871.1 sulfur carrier protein [Solirubrobacteraceae bacterium]